MNKTKVAFGIGIALVVLAVFTASATADNVVYFDPDPSCAAPGEEITVTLWLDNADGVASFGVDVEFDPEVVNLTSGTAGDFPTMFSFYPYYDDHFVRVSGITEDWMDIAPGHWKLADITLLANNSGTSALDHVNFPVSGIFYWTGADVINQVWNNGTFNCPCSTPGEFTKELVPGWNLISLPLTATDMTVSNVIETSLSNSYDELYKYDAAAHNFVPLSSASEMEHGVGYFIHMTAGGTWTYSGSAYTSMNVELKEGLNMIGWLDSSKGISETNLSSSSLDYYVARFDAATQDFEVFNPVAPSEFNDFSDMERGEGYFVSAKSETTLSESC